MDESLLVAWKKSSLIISFLSGSVERCWIGMAFPLRPVGQPCFDFLYVMAYDSYSTALPASPPFCVAPTLI
jgi:hypothetical protein